MDPTINIHKEAIQGEEVVADKEVTYDEGMDVREEDVPPPQVPSMDTLLGDIYEL